MPSGPTTSLDLSSPELAADPYPFFAEERARHEIAWSEAAGTWLTFSHAAASAVLRDRRLQRLWRDREPADYLEPFNLLHRNQMMENEPPVHTRLRRPVAAAFNRGHVDRLRPRVEALAAQLLDEVDPAGFDVIGSYAEPLPVLVIAELLGVPTSYAPQLRAWSQAIVHMYEVAPSQEVVDAAVAAAAEFAGLVREQVAERRVRPSDDLISDLVALSSTEAGRLTEGLSDDEVVASVVLLLNAGHEASVNVFGNGLVSMLRAGARPADDVALTIEEMLRYDAALQLFERTAAEPVELRTSSGSSVVIEPGQKVAALLGAANRDPALFEAPDEFRPGRDPNPHLAFSAGIHFCLGAPLARMELTESLAALTTRFPGLSLAAEPEARGTFVLKGYRSVEVSA
ncbi:cytochrome P450 [Nocardioides sp. CER19]|uniref:cytochrome P450 n=1 Tax=Nocardioides sp. CER19 TaxID=3038538 RepID=UPI00244B2827|nr:cytochrome P450 [Nocardioides sp. CER19]MDH2413699.1 cytochrome P450 [Nocardioides sp. CER19]